MNQPNGSELAANAARALERYRAEERRLEEQAMAIQIHLQLVKEFISALTTAPRAKRTVRVVDGPVIDPAELPPEGEQYADKD
jgi:hypothetical protein